MSSMNRDSFTSFFPNINTFYLFSCLIALSRTTSTILNESDKNKPPWLVPDFGRKASSLLPLSVMLTVGFSLMPFISLRKFLSIPSSSDVSLNVC